MANLSRKHFLSDVNLYGIEMQAVPVVDGNVIRVLCRLRAISMNPKASSTVKLFW